MMLAMNKHRHDLESKRDGLYARKSLGQHFLKSTSALRQIIEAAHLKPTESVLEIGPGEGVLTRVLLDTGVHVIAIEKDHRAISLLQTRFDSEIQRGQLQILEGDFLKIDLATLGLRQHDYAVVANIPYYITGAILEKCLEEEPRANRLVLLVQKEVGERIVARDGKESLLSIAVKVFGQPSIIAKVPRGAFQPPPKVDSAILAVNNVSGIQLQQSALSPKDFFPVLKAGFAHKRKLVRRNLETIWPKAKITRIWNMLNLDLHARAEELQTSDWLAIVRASQEHSEA